MRGARLVAAAAAAACWLLCGTIGSAPAQPQTPGVVSAIFSPGDTQVPSLPQGGAPPVASADSFDIAIIDFHVNATEVFAGEPIGLALSVTYRLVGTPVGGIVNPDAAFYLSSDPIITKSDLRLVGGQIGLEGTGHPDSLALRIPASISIPKGLAGPAYLGVRLDDVEAEHELDEDNNTASQPINVVPAADARRIDSVVETWDRGIDPDRWLSFGPRTPGIVYDTPCTGAAGVETGRTDSCFSGVWMSRQIQWEIGSRLTFEFATNVTGARRPAGEKLLRVGLCAGWDPLLKCAGSLGPLSKMLWANISTGEASHQEISFQAAGISQVIPTIEYPASEDTTCHTLTFISFTGDLVGILLDDVLLGYSSAKITLASPLFIFLEGTGLETSDVVTEIHLSPGILGQGSLIFPTTTAGDTTFADLVLTNPDTLPLAIDGIEFGNGPFAVTPDFADSIAAGLFVLAPGGVDTMQILFAPLVGDRPLVGAVTLFRGVEVLANLSLSGGTRSLGLFWNNPEDYESGVITQGERVRIKMELTQHVTADSLILHFARGDMVDYLSVPMSIVGGDEENGLRYLGTIPGEMAGASGLEFYVSAHNGPVDSLFGTPESPERLRVSVTSLNFQRLPPPETYGLISLPLEVPDGTTLMSFLAEDLGDSSQWRMYAFDRAAQDYEDIHPASNYQARQGESWWLIKRGSGGLDGPDPATGLSTPLDSAYVMRLTPGWNLIADPFAFTVEWDSCLVDGVPAPEAMAAGTVSSLIGWDWNAGAYNDSVEILWPFEGLWLRNETSGSLALSIPPISAGIFSTEGNGPAKSPATDGWRLRLVASSEASEDRINVIGASPAAAAGWDALDRREPPSAPGDAIALHFPHGDWGGRAGSYTADVRADVPEGASVDASAGAAPLEWAFDVARPAPAGNEPTLVTLRAEGIASLPGDFDAVLVDRALDREFDLRAMDAYQFVCGRREVVSTESACRFAVRVTKRGSGGVGGAGGAGLPAVDRLAAVVPNPFNPATVLHYDVAHAGPLRLAVYDAQGRRIRILFDGPREPGRYEAVWNGKDDRGGDAPSGVYFGRLERGPDRSAVKLLLVR